MTIPRAPEGRVIAFRREIERMLGHLTDEQREKFRVLQRASPWRDLEHCPDTELNTLYELVRRTLLANSTARKEGKGQP